MEKYMIRVVLLQAILIVFAIKLGYFGEDKNIIEENKQREKQPYRTAFHFQPPKNWMNDPNGPMYYNGLYHLFYQYNPHGATWGNISWAHSVSYDLIDWIHIDHVFTPAEPYDARGCWSGSVTILPHNNMPVILYTGANADGEEVQNLATPRNVSDPFLREWVKSPQNPLMTRDSDIDPGWFRDPTTAWQKPDGTWCVLIGSRIGGYGGATLYKSRDFISWSRGDRPLHVSNKTGMWECPDFYPIGTIVGGDGLDTSANGGADILHVLKVSLMSGHDDYIIGQYDSTTEELSLVGVDFMDDRIQLRYDYGIFYGSKTFYDPAKRRRVLWAWVLEADDEAGGVGRGWSGLQSLPRSVLLDEDRKQLIQWPIEEADRLREGKVGLENREIEGGTVLEIEGITASQADVEVSFRIPNLDGIEHVDDDGSLDPQLLCSQNNASVNGVFGPFGLLVLATKDLKEQTAIFFRIFKGHREHIVLMCTDQSRSSLKTPVKKVIFGSFLDVDPNQEISLRTLIDHSIVENFGGKGKSCITTRVYPTLAIFENSHIYVFNNGAKNVLVSSLNAWSMKKASIDLESI